MKLVVILAISALTSILFVTCSCNKNEDPKVNVIPITDTTIKLPVLQSFSFKIASSNETYSVRGKHVAEGRCFLSSCNTCFGSVATVEFESATGSKFLKIPGCIEQTLIESADNYKENGFKVSLLGLFPYPNETNQPVPLKDYYILVNIRKI